MFYKNLKHFKYRILRPAIVSCHYFAVLKGKKNYQTFVIIAAYTPFGTYFKADGRTGTNLRSLSV